MLALPEPLEPLVKMARTEPLAHLALLVPLVSEHPVKMVTLELLDPMALPAKMVKMEPLALPAHLASMVKTALPEHLERMDSLVPLELLEPLVPLVLPAEPLDQLELLELVVPLDLEEHPDLLDLLA